METTLEKEYEQKDTIEKDIIIDDMLIDTHELKYKKYIWRNEYYKFDI